MNQISSLSDALLGGSSALDRLFSQKSGAESGTSVLDSLFSNFMSETSAMQSAFTKGMHETTDVSPPTLSSSETSATESPLGQTTGGANDLLSILRKILAVLRRNETRADATSREQAARASDAAAETASNASELMATVSAIVEDLTDAAQTVEDSASSDSEKRSLSEIILELLTLMQLIVRTMQQSPLAEGGTGASPEEKTLVIQASTDATNGLMAATETTPADDADATLLSPIPPAESPAAEAVSLLALLKEAEKAAEQLFETFAQGASSGNSDASVDSSVTSSSSTVSDATDLLAQLETDIQNALADLKQQTQAGLTGKEPPLLAQGGPETPETPPYLPSEDVLFGGTQNPENDDSGIPLAAQMAASLRAAMAKNTGIKTAPAEPPTEEITKPEIQINTASSGTQEEEGLFSGSDVLLNGKKSFSLSDAESSLTSPLAAEGSQATGVYNFASTLSAFRAANGGTRGLPSIVDQVLLYMNRNVKNGQSQMSLQLQPSDLGKISVKLKFGEDGKVQGSVVADNPKTLEMLQKDSRSLERALQDAGLRAEPGSLEFSLSGQKSQNNAAENANDGGKGPEEGARLADVDDAGLIDSYALSETYYITPTGVNIRV